MGAPGGGEGRGIDFLSPAAHGCGPLQRCSLADARLAGMTYTPTPHRAQVTTNPFLPRPSSNFPCTSLLATRTPLTSTSKVNAFNSWAQCSDRASPANGRRVASALRLRPSRRIGFEFFEQEAYLQAGNQKAQKGITLWRGIERRDKKNDTRKTITNSRRNHQNRPPRTTPSLARRT